VRVDDGSEYSGKDPCCQRIHCPCAYSGCRHANQGTLVQAHWMAVEALQCRAAWHIGASTHLSPQETPTPCVWLCRQAVLPSPAHPPPLSARAQSSGWVSGCILPRLLSCAQHLTARSSSRSSRGGLRAHDKSSCCKGCESKRPGLVTGESDAVICPPPHPTPHTRSKPRNQPPRTKSADLESTLHHPLSRATQCTQSYCAQLEAEVASNTTEIARLRADLAHASMMIEGAPSGHGGPPALCWPWRLDAQLMLMLPGVEIHLAHSPCGASQGPWGRRGLSHAMSPPPAPCTRGPPPAAAPAHKSGHCPPPSLLMCTRCAARSGAARVQGSVPGCPTREPATQHTRHRRTRCRGPAHLTTQGCSERAGVCAPGVELAHLTGGLLLCLHCWDHGQPEP